MADPIGTFSGLASGVQWRDLVDQLMSIETQRKLDPVTARRSLVQKRIEAWSQYQALAVTFRDAAKVLRDPSIFGALKVAGGTSPASGRTLVTATAASTAAPGTYAVEVLDTARANKMSGHVVSSASAALGMAGEFAVNGRVITLAASDTLAMVRDKINALNAGATPTGVSASVLSTGGTQHRLILSSEQAGSAGIELVDGSTQVLQSLGIVDGSRTLNVAADGGVQSHRVTSTTATIASMLGVSLPQPSTIEVGGRVIAVDLTVDSLASIAAKILAAGGTASVVTESSGGREGHRLVTSDTVTAATPDGQRTLEVLGFLKNGRSGVAQVVKSENVFSEAGGATASTTTLLSDLQVNGNPLALAAGDSFVIQGQRGDGTLVSSTFTLAPGDTLQTLVDRINDPATGFGSGSRTAVASIVGGQIVLTDSVAGDSQLALSLSATRVADGSTVSLGRHLTDTVGRLREVVAGSDARVRVDGVLVRRPSNIITDVLAGVTLSVQQAEVGTTVTLSVERDVDVLAGRMKDVANAYNALLKFRNEQAKADAPLRGNPTLRASLGTLTNTLLASVSGISGSYVRAGAIGLALQTDGTLALDEAAFRKVIATNYADVVTLFSTAGTSTNPALSYWGSSSRTVAGTYAVDISAPATTPSASGSGFSGIYVDDGTPDTLTITDSISGATGSVSLASGDTIDAIVARLNALLAGSRMAISASRNGNDLVLTGTRHGSASTFTVAWTGGGADSTSQLGLSAATYGGTDVAGTIGGLAATGSGQVLTATPPLVSDPTNGLSIAYAGTATGAVGDLTFTLGLGGLLYNVADVFAAPNGTIFDQTESLKKSVNELATRADTLQQALDRKRAALMKQFTAMESAISRIQQQGTALTSFIASLQARRE